MKTERLLRNYCFEDFALILAMYAAARVCSPKLSTLCLEQGQFHLMGGGRHRNYVECVTLQLIHMRQDWPAHMKVTTDDHNSSTTLKCANILRDVFIYYPQPYIKVCITGTT